MRAKLLTTLSLSAMLMVTFLSEPMAQSGKKRRKAKKEVANSDKESQVKSIDEVIKTCREYPGLFTLYQDTTKGTLYMLVRDSQLNREYIYFNHIVDGVVDANFPRGGYGFSQIFSLSKYFNRIDFIKENPHYYFDPENPLKRAEEANINRPVLSSRIITAFNEKRDAYLVEVDDLFLKESFSQIKPSPNPKVKPGTAFEMGKLSSDKSKYTAVKNYPKNTDVSVEYVYESPYPVNTGSKAVTDPRFVSIKIRHSIIEVPQNDFQPRFEDPRIGYFTSEVNDMTSTEATPYRDPIHRWHLEKKYPEQAVSEPVEPIVWWIENTTPLEIRPVIRKAVLKWNTAFEKAGFKNAIVVKQQPDDADWDAGDIRYNVLRWTSSPDPMWAGYGPSFANPRTGQILGADVMLEHIFLTARVKEDQLFNTSGSKYHQRHTCNLSAHLQMSNLQGSLFLQATGFDSTEESNLLNQSINMLLLHEVGHTLGLNHNFKGSQFLSVAALEQLDPNEEYVLTASVMDYSSVHLSKQNKGAYYDIQPGPYDIWAIEYGYTPALSDEQAEKERLEKILSRSNEPQLAFSNDADDMRAPGKGIDPKAMIWDMSSDAIQYATNRMEMLDEIYPELIDKVVEDNESYQMAKNAYTTLFRAKKRALQTVSRYVGGVYVDRSFKNQEGATQPFTPVAREDQKRAMQTLKTYAFAPHAFEAQEVLYPYLQQQRRGFNFFGKTEDPKVHEEILAVQKEVLDHLMHQNVWHRIANSQLYGNEYSLHEMADDLTDAVFTADLSGSVNTHRQNLQHEYLDRLVKVMANDSAFSHMARNVAYHQIGQLQALLSKREAADASTLAHRKHLLFKIEQAMDDD